QNADAKGRVDRIRRRAKLLKLGRRALIGVTAAAIAALVSVPAIRFFERVQAARDERERQEGRANELRAAAGASGPGTSGPGGGNAASPSAPAAGTDATTGSTPGTTGRTGSASTAVTTPRSRDRTPPPRAESRVARLDPQKPLSVVLAQKVPARVLVDGSDLGQDLMIPAQLTPGQHRVTIQHRCCADLNTEIDVRPNRQRYTLETGAPKPAELKITGGDLDAQVWYSDE